MSSDNNQVSKTLSSILCTCTLCCVRTAPLYTRSLACTNVHIHVASQMWCLARALIGDKITEGDKRWENFLQLMSIVDYSLYPYILE